MWRATPLLLLAAGCLLPAGEEQVESVSGSIVYGTDDRREYFETEDPVLRELTAEVTVALMRRSEVELGSDGIARIVAPSWQEAGSLCSGQRFAEQPSAAVCTGTLMGDDLVLTAGHCLDAIPCSDLVAVFGYHYVAPGQLREIPNRDVVACSALIAKHVDLRNNPTRVDYAWIRLGASRPAGRRAELVDGWVPAGVDANVQTISFGAGLPAKIDPSGRVRDARPETLDYFVTNLDAFHGASGAAVYDASYGILGVLGRGGDDLLLTDAGCNVTFNELDVQDTAREQVTYAFQALDGLCRGDQPETGLCPGVAEPSAGCRVAGSPTAGDRAWAVVLALGAVIAASRRRR